MCLIISHVSDASGSQHYNQSSLLAAISRAPPAVTPGQLSSDFITACMPRFTFPDTPVLLYTSLCCLLMWCYKHPVVMGLIYRAATITLCGPLVTWITQNISDTWTLNRSLKTRGITLKWPKSTILRCKVFFFFFCIYQIKLCLCIF